jgi:hypothetical protein
LGDESVSQERLLAFDLKKAKKNWYSDEEDIYLRNNIVGRGKVECVSMLVFVDAL